jgi:hypothetical protein
LASVARTGLAKVDLPEKQRKQIEKDLDELLKGVKTAMPAVGASFNFTFLTGTGYESYSYDYGEFPSLDGSQPLTLLEHVGGSPILAVVGRSKPSREGYADLVKWLKAAHGHADEIVKAKLPAEGKEKYEAFNKAFTPLLQRLDQITSQLLQPALEDGQGGLVIDAKWSSKQWHKNLPETDKALPLPELALVIGVSDAGKLQKAMTEYREVVNEALAKVRELVPESQMPEIKIPAPRTEKAKGGTVYFWSLPEELGLDKQVVPAAGLGARVAVLAPSVAMAERLLSPRPLKVEGGPLADPKRPLVAAVYVNGPALIDALTPWVEWGVETATRNTEIPAPLGDVGKQAHTILEVLKCFRGATSATYLDEGALVTHSQSVYRDR